MIRRRRLAIAGIILAATALAGVRQWVLARDCRRRELRLQELVRQAAGTPAAFRAKAVNSPEGVAVRSVLTRVEPPPNSCNWGTPGGAARYLDDLERAIRRDLQWRIPPPVFAAPPLAVPLRIDGMTAPGEWDGAWRSDGEYPLDSAERESSATRWRLGWDRHFVYFCAEIADTEVIETNIRHPYRDDSFEFFLLPDERLHTYFELVFSPSGAAYLRTAVQSARQRYSLEPEAPAGLEYRVGRHAGGYVVEGRLPFAALPGYLLGNPPKPGETLKFMMVRTDRDAAGRYRRTTPFPACGDGHNLAVYATLRLLAPAAD